MITKEFGVHVTAPSRQQWPGLLRIILNMRWETEPGWIELTSDSPVLCVVLSETGGRCQTRIQPEQPAQGDYFGTGHLSFVAPSQPLISMQPKCGTHALLSINSIWARPTVFVRSNKR